MMIVEKQSVAQRLADGRFSLPEALRLSMSLAEELRKLQDEGRVHGALTPASLAITPTGIEVLPPRTAPGEITPYTAPELLRGRPADTRSDMFSFGAIVYEIVTGRPAFEAESAEALATQILDGFPPPSGSPALDRFIANCLAKDPSARWPRMQKAILELKLLSVSARRAATIARRGGIEAMVKAEVQQIEMRIAGYLESQQKSSVDLQHALTESFHGLRAQFTEMDRQLKAVQERSSRAEEAVEAMILRVSALAETLQADSARIASAEVLLQTRDERIARAEEATESVRQHASELAESTAVQLHALEQTVRSHATAIESARMAVSQTDDLVERVVEALESLQNTVLEQSEERSAAVN